MSASQGPIIREDKTTERCGGCGKMFSHSQFIDHLFGNRECMKKYWEEEEKIHMFRLRQRRVSRVLK